MSNLMILADAATVTAKKVDACCQTTPDLQTLQPSTSSNSVGISPKNQFGPGRDFSHSCATDFAHHESSNTFLPNPSSFHDYLKQTDFDFLVNTTHDYYSRVWSNSDEREHSYAYFLPPVQHNPQNFDDASFEPTLDDPEPGELHEEIANLAEHMGLEPQNSATLSGISGFDTSQNVFEEVVNEDLFDDFNVDNISLFDFDADSIETVELGDADFNDLMNIYLSASNENTVPQPSIEPITHPKETAKQQSITVPSHNKDIQKLPCFEERHLSSRETSVTVEKATGKDIETCKKIVCQWSECEAVFDKLSDLSDHLDWFHLRYKSELVCKWKDCQRSERFSRRFLLVRHLRTHTNDKPFACEQCVSCFGTKELLRIHTRRHEKKVPMKCPKCPKLFVSTAERTRHLKIHETFTAENLFSCGINDCPREFRSKNSLNKHRKLKHSSSTLP